MDVIDAGAALTGLDHRQQVAVALPILVPAAMTATFIIARERFGDHIGYVTGFAAYWATAGGLSLAILGRERAGRLFIDRRPRLGRPAALGAALLIWPVAGAVSTRLIPEIGDASRAMVVAAAIVAVANSVMEELLWRGVYVTLWPDSVWLGWVWPAIGFGAWHLAPQVIHPSSLGPFAYVAAATALGLSWGWGAWRTGSLRWTAISHFFTDFSGIRNALFFLGSW